ncbi:iron-regulated transporter [Penicillium canescens]|nr:iron-regulated transporter [Penicillium canescens]
MAKLTCEQTGVNVHTPLIAREEGEIPEHPRRERGSDSQTQVPASIAYLLYISHFLSTWNSRVFEFGAVLYLATIYPSTLLPMSVYALSRGLAAILFAPAVGHYIDVGNRLQVVRVSIGAFLPVLMFSKRMSQVVNQCLLATLALLACIEKLCSVMNLVSVEKDWVVVVAGEDHESLKTMNVQMRRIDLICKLIGPLFIAFIDSSSPKTAIRVNFGMSAGSVAVEYFSIARVYYKVPKLQEPRRFTTDEILGVEGEPSNIWRGCCNMARKFLGDFRSYLHHRMFLPSFAGALLYLTVLSFAGQMVTWLLAEGYDSTQISVARTLSVIFEVLATWVAPWLMGKVGLIRAGIWLANWQVACLIGGTVIFRRSSSNPFISASGLVGGAILSRVGLRGFDLCVQIIIQEVS